MSEKSWSGRFDKGESPLMEAFNASLSVDKRLHKQDIEGSLAHAGMLKKIGILSKNEHIKIKRGLRKILKEIEEGSFPFALAREDIHMNIEARLSVLVGAAGEKLHTARSRNDQVALDLKLYAREHTSLVLQKIKALQKNLVVIAEKNLSTILPGYTHLQRAQPMTLAHHLLAYFEMLQRDRLRFRDNSERLKQCPLGAGALAGSTLPIDRDFVARKLGFTEPTRNSLDTVSDRDFVLDFLSASSILMMHLSRLCEELVLWNSSEFGFVTLPQEFCTGSSLMPQKINPDAAELIRGKTGRVYGNLISLLTTLKSLPLAYNKDMQEDKPPFFDTVDTVNTCLDVLNLMLPKVKFNANKMWAATRDGFLLATDVADYLVRKGLPFRMAHAVVGKLVKLAIKADCGLEDIPLNTMKTLSHLFDKNSKEVLNIKKSLENRRVTGGPAPLAVKRELTRAKRQLR